MPCLPRTRSAATHARWRRCARRSASLVLMTACALACALGGHVAEAAEAGTAARGGATEAGLRRVVSLNPSLTAIALALGAGERLVAIDDYSARLEPELAALPRVGGLHSPNLEAVVALEPDAVVLVPSVAQRDFRTRLESLGVRVEVFENTHFAEVLENIERMGRLLARPAEARARIAAIEGARSRAGEVAARGGAPKVVLVIQREPLYVVGRGSFMAEMLSMLGASNAGDAFDEPYPRVGYEWLVAAAPDVLIDMTDDAEAAHAYWQRFESLPAVRAGRVHGVEPGLLSLPGPDLDRSLAALAAALYGAEAGRTVAGPAPPAGPPPPDGPS